MPSLSQRVTIYAGLGSLCLIILVATVFQKEIKTQYHVFNLRNQSNYLSYILHEPEGSPERAAIRKYVKSREGKMALFKHVLWIIGYSIDKIVKTNPTYIALSVDPEQGLLEVMDNSWVSADSVAASSMVFRNDAPLKHDRQVKRQGFTHNFYSTRVNWNWIGLLTEYLDDGQQVTLDRYPGVVFEFLHNLPGRLPQKEKPSGL